MKGYCTDCIHYKVCGNEGVDDSAMTFCADKQTDGDLDGDLISRDDAIKLVNYALAENRDALEVLENIPSAEKTAEWRIVGKTTLHYECSKCGGAGDKWDKFCKHCGARMKEEEE